MNNAIIDQLNRSIDARFVGDSIPSDPQIADLLKVVDELRLQPCSEFRLRLLEKLRGLSRTHAALEAGALSVPEFRSLVFSPVPRAHIAISFALHATALAGLFASGFWIVAHRHDVQRQIVSVLTESPYILGPSRSEAHGGGGGGDREKLAASRGTAPRFASEQFTPPSAVVRNESPVLPEDPTLIGPPDTKLPLSPVNGDPMATILAPPSNGTGSGGGIGSGTGGGVGEGRGPGLGPGEGGGIGGGVYHVGGGVGAPRALYAPDPEYSEEARRAKFQGVVVLDAVIGADGRPRDLHVIRSLGMGLDQKALDAVSRWRFDPAHKDGRPVAVKVAIEVAFHLY